MRGRHRTVRTIALLGAASAAIHQLRYAIAYGDGASRAIAAHPHGYLQAALPGIATALLIAIAALVMHAARGRRPAASQPPRRSLLSLWLACAALLAAIYGLQETAEGAGAVAGSGWIGLALAVPAGLLVALAVRGARAAESFAGRTPLVAVAVHSLQIAAAPVLTPGRISRPLIRSRGPPTPFVA